MLAESLAWLQQVPPVAALRASRWVYPLVNAGHVAGLGILIGAIFSLDLRLLGFWRHLPIRTLAAVLVPVSVFGLLLAISTGALLFSVHAVEYAAMTIFRIKLLLIAAAIANALLLRRAIAWEGHREVALAGTTTCLRLAGILSIGLWLGALICGRMLGYLR